MQCDLMAQRGNKNLNKTRHRAVNYWIKVILYNVKQDFHDMGPIEGNWIDLALGSNKWRALVRTVMNLQVRYNAGDFLTTLGTASFSGSVLHWFN